MRDKNVSTSIIFTSQYDDGTESFCSHVYDWDTNYPTFNMSKRDHNLYDFSDLDTEELTRLFFLFQKDMGDEPCYIKRVTMTSEICNDLVSEDDMREMRQRHALSKLNQQDIEALGLTNIAVYIKTKFHNA